MTSTHYSFFGLDKATFANRAERRFFFKAAPFRTVLSHIADGFRNGKAIAIITGEAGTGKTTLCHYLVDKLPLCHLASVIVNPLHTAGEVLATICDGLHVDYPTQSPDETVILNRLRDFLTTAGPRGERTIIIMDEAQNIGSDLYQLLVGLTTSDNPETTKHHIVFVGQPELAEHLETAGFRSRSQENVVRCELAPMNKRDTAAYIRHRVAIGGATDLIFTPAAEATVFRYTNGVSRSINLVCDYALQIAQEHSEWLVTPRTMKLAVAVLSPPVSEQNLLKRGFAVLTDGAELLANGVAHTIRDVWSPLQVKFSRGPNTVQQESTSQIKVLSWSGANHRVHDLSLTEFQGQTFLGANDTATRSFVAGAVHSSLRRRVVSYESEPDIDARVAGFDIPKGMVVVPDVTLRSAYSEAEISVASFLLDQIPVTNKLYVRYVEETGNAPPNHWWAKSPPENMLNYPVVDVSFKDACGFAEWAGKRLPTASEWEAAARNPGNRKFPWGDDWQSARCNCPESGSNKTVSVDFHPAGSSLDGCLDLVGNVWEWVEGGGSEHTDPESGYAWVFGGSYRHECMIDDAIARSMLLQMNRYAYVGFRCANDLS